MSTINQIYSFLCHQDAFRSFTICDHPLPFCQRCTGLYLAIALTFIFLLATNHHKKSLPPGSILCVNVASILIMIVFGFHYLDPGPKWRLWSGLLYGNAIAYLIFPATWRLCKAPTPQDYSRLQIFAFFAFFALLNTIPLWFPLQSHAFFVLVNIGALLGLAAPLICVLGLACRLLKTITRFFILKGLAHEPN